MRKLIIGFILGGIIFGSIGIYAANYIASDITYIKNGKEATVNEALDELYEKSNNSSLYYLGKGRSFDIKSLFPEIDYTKLTIDNFIVSNISYGESTGFVSHTKHAYGKIYSSSGISSSYNNETGILSISGGVSGWLAVGPNDQTGVYHLTQTYSSNISASVWFTPNTLNVIDKTN